MPLPSSTTANKDQNSKKRKKADAAPTAGGEDTLLESIRNELVRMNQRLDSIDGNVKLLVACQPDATRKKISPPVVVASTTTAAMTDAVPDGEVSMSTIL